jgi:hypothetical protein
MGFGNGRNVCGLVLRCKECGGAVSVGFHWEGEYKKGWGSHARENAVSKRVVGS